MDQIELLANYIMFEIEGEPSKDEGAGSCAVRLLKQYRAELAECQRQRDALAEALRMVEWVDMPDPDDDFFSWTYWVGEFEQKALAALAMLDKE